MHKPPSTTLKSKDNADIVSRDRWKDCGLRTNNEQEKACFANMLTPLPVDFELVIHGENCEVWDENDVTKLLLPH
jgi:hypothetical protein